VHTKFENKQMKTRGKRRCRLVWLPKKWCNKNGNFCSMATQRQEFNVWAVDILDIASTHHWYKMHEDSEIWMLIISSETWFGQYTSPHAFLAWNISPVKVKEVCLIFIMHKHTTLIILDTTHVLIPRLWCVIPSLTWPYFKIRTVELVLILRNDTFSRF